MAMGVIVAYVGIGLFAEGFHQSEAEDQLGGVRVEAVFNSNIRVEGEPVPKVIPDGDARCDGGFSAEGAAAGGEDGFHLGGEEKARFVDKNGARDDGEIAEAGCGGDALLVFPDVRDFDDHAEAFREGPFEFEFRFVLGDAVALAVGVVEEKVAPREGGLDPEGVDDWCSEFAEMEVFEGFEIFVGFLCDG